MNQTQNVDFNLYDRNGRVVGTLVISGAIFYEIVNFYGRLFIWKNAEQRYEEAGRIFVYNPGDTIASR
jgi:hypothetical protein